MRNKSIRICEKCGEYHEVRDTRTLKTGTIKRSMICSGCGHREYTFEIKVKKEGKTLTKRDRDLHKAMEVI